MRSYFLLLFSGLLLGGGHTAFAQSEEQADALLFLIYENTETPFAHVDESGEFQGLLPELLRQAAQRVGREVRFEYANRKRAEDFLYQGKADAILLNREWATDPDMVLFSDAMYDNNEYLYATRAMPRSGSLVENVTGKVICVRQHYRYPKLDPLFEQGLVYRTALSTQAEMIEMLAKGRCDLAPIREFRVRMIQANSTLDVPLYRSPAPIDKAGIHIAVHPSEEAFLQAFNDFLAEQKAQGAITLMMERYFPKSKHFEDNHTAQQDSQLYIVTHPEPPFIVLSPDNQLSGYAVELVRGIVAEAGFDHEVKMYAAPWARVEKEATENANVLAFALARLPEREDKYHWITPITGNIFGVYAHKSARLSMQSMQDVAKLGSIGSLRGDVRREILERYGDANVVEFNTWEQTMQSFIKGRIDAVFFSDAGLDYYCREMTLDCSGIERIFIYQELFSYLVMSKPGTPPELADAVRQAAEKYKSGAGYEAMSGYWLQHYRDTIGMPMHVGDGVLKLWNPIQRKSNDITD